MPEEAGALEAAAAAAGDDGLWILRSRFAFGDGAARRVFRGPIGAREAATCHLSGGEEAPQPRVVQRYVQPGDALIEGRKFVLKMCALWVWVRQSNCFRVRVSNWTAH